MPPPSRFSGPRFDAAANNSPPMKKGEAGEPVRVLQQALIELGHPMPVSTKKYGSPDGIYGDETKEAVKAFQRKNGLAHEADGQVGRNTLAKLRGKPLPPAKPLPPLPGGPGGPTLTPEEGLRRLIIQTLDDPDIMKVFLVMGTDEINWGWFRLIRNMVEKGKPGISIVPKLPGGDAAYNHEGDAFEFQASSVPLFLTGHVNVRALIVHESVHAIMDQRGKLTRHAHAEATAYVAQCMYLKTKGTTLEMADKTDTNMVDALKEANRLADEYLKDQDFRASKAELDALYLLIDNSKLYWDAPTVIPYNGILE